MNVSGWFVPPGLCSTVFVSPSSPWCRGFLDTVLDGFHYSMLGLYASLNIIPFRSSWKAWSSVYFLLPLQGSVLFHPGVLPVRVHLCVLVRLVLVDPVGHGLGRFRDVLRVAEVVARVSRAGVQLHLRYRYFPQFPGLYPFQGALNGGGVFSNL